MSIETVILLESVTSESFVSNKQKGAGYHLRNGGIHTFVASFSNWSGTINIQGSLALYPGETDWVNITTLGEDSSDYDSDININVTGNFVWVRAKCNTTSGEIVSIRYNY